MHAQTSSLEIGLGLLSQDRDSMAMSRFTNLSNEYWIRAMNEVLKKVGPIHST